MNINGSYNGVNFKGVCINKSKMNLQQKSLANKVADLVITHKDYNEIAKKKVDLCFLPTKAPMSIIIKAIDLQSGKFIKVEGTERAQQITVNSQGDKYAKADSVLEFYKKVCASNRPPINEEDIVNGNTTLFRANTNLHEDVLESYDSLKDSLDKKIAKELAVDNFIETLPEEGFYFDF